MDTLAHPPGSPSGSSLDSDEANSSSAHVYFGPIQSPEKKFLAQEEVRQLIQAPLSPSPVRRSPRLSGLSPPIPQPTADPREETDKAMEDDENEMAEAGERISRDITPDLDPLRQDEPSSLLASKIMRAHDNPSPPPHLLQDSVRSPFRALSASPDPVDPFQDVSLLHNLSQAEANDPAGIHRQLASPNASQPDLISFDSWSTPIPGSPIAVDDNESSRLPRSCIETIDDLLFDSPADLSRDSKTLEEDNTLPFPPAVIPAQTSHQTESSSSITQSDSSVASSGQAAVSVTNEGASSSALHILPRRSSRKSTSPLKRPLLDESNTPSTPNVSSRGGSPEAVKWSVPSESEPTQETGTQVKHDASESGRRRSKGISAPVPTFQRELGSLSPTSESLLARLLPSAASNDLSPSSQGADIRPLSLSPTPAQSDHEPQPPQSPLARHTPVFRPQVASPQRLSTPSRLPSSPLKFSFTRDDVTRTPARRVPIQDALAQGIPSVQKPIKLFSRTALDDPLRSPAKRVPIIDLDPSPGVPSPSSKVQARARSASIEPKAPVQAHPRSRSVEPSPLAGGQREKLLNRPPALPRIDSKLPFPLIASSTNDLHPPIPEEIETSDQTLLDDSASPSKPTKIPSPAKSMLKQPTVSSRIPRMDVKPYARAKPKPPKGKDGISVKSNKATPTPQPSRDSTASSSNSNSSDSSQVPVGQGTTKPSTLATLKRKREVPSAPDTQPLRIRQVMPGMFGGKYAAKPQQSATQTETQAPQPPQPSPSKPTAPFRMRKVVDGMFARGSGTEKTVKGGPVQAPSSELPALERTTPPQSSEVEGPVDLDAAPPLTNASDVDAPPSDVPPEITNSDSHDGKPGQTPDAQSNDAPTGIRRTSRARKPVLPSMADVFSSSMTRAPAPRKRILRSEGDGFMGMSATALKALTNSNTEKNQRLYTVTLATETIRKDGLRPESPTVKMRTIVQKQQDEKDRQRSDRAERRARRSDEGSVANGMADSSDAEDDFMLGTEGPDDLHSKELPKHRRGPGDDEDYETPEKIPRPLKRPKFGLEGEEVAERAQRQVKWDRGLSTTIYLDDIHPNPKSRPKDFTISKGCLASNSKNRHLDTMGNLIDAENTPLTSLEHVNVVVKKFVYDNDLEVEPTPPPQPPKTRSRSKKAKS